MNLPGFNALASLSKPTQNYRAISETVSALGVLYNIRPQTATIGRIGGLTLGVSYPPPNGGCQICYCSCYPFPC
jgi:hypothetical protein